MSRHQFWYFSAIFLLSDPTLSTAFPPTVTEAVPSLCHEHHAVTLDDHFFEALAPIELRLTDPGTLITEEETPNSQKLNVHEAGHHDMSGIYEHFDGPIDFDGVLLLRHGGHPWTLISPYQPPGPSPEQTGSTVIESRPSPLSLMLTQGRHDQPDKDVNIPGSRKRPWQDLDNQVNVHASASTEEVSTDAMTFQTAPTREITADQLDAIMKANSVHKVTGGQNGDFQIFLSELQTRVFDFLVGLRLHANSVTSKRGQEFRQRIIKHVNELLNPRLLSGCRKSDDECETPKGFPLGLKTINKLQGAANASKLWIVRIVKWTDRGKRQAVKGFILASRIAKVYEIMNFYHTIASENLSSVNREQFKSTIDHLRQWFCDIIFEGTDSSLPLLGLVRLPQKPEDPQSLFGDLQIHLAKVLMNPGDVGNAQLPRISLALFGNWYKTQSHKIDFPRLEKNEFWQWIYQAALDETAQEKHKSWSTKI